MLPFAGQDPATTVTIDLNADLGEGFGAWAAGDRLGFGTTDTPLWDLEATPPALLTAGIRVRFRDLDAR